MALQAATRRLARRAQRAPARRRRACVGVYVCACACQKTWFKAFLSPSHRLVVPPGFILATTSFALSGSGFRVYG